MSTYPVQIPWCGGVEPVRQEDNHAARLETGSDAISVPVSLYPLGENHPLAAVLGAFDNEPLWDEWMEEINAYRREVTAAESNE